MYYHASRTKNIKELEPRISNHKVPLIYFSSKRENVLVYLSNAVEKYCKETNFKYDGIYSKWGPYSFDKNGILCIEEYYPNFLYETYKGVSGYIYKVKENINLNKLNDIPYAYTSSNNVKVENFEYIEDAYDEIMKEVKEKRLKVIFYEDFIKIKKDWLIDIINKEYNDPNIGIEYKYFLESKFDFLNNKK